jgi:uncharacterized protein
METAVICIVAFLTALLTFFSGFGLGTILMPVFALFFPLDLAIALTGIVHFANNLFKFALIGKNTNIEVLLKFGLPAILASFLGAFTLIQLSELPNLYHYTIGGSIFIITPIKIIIAILLITFSLFELLPTGQLQFNKNKLFIGGLLSGFFGGLSGIQGAIRSAFLIKCNLSKESYIATGVVIACMVDISRLSIYASKFNSIASTQYLTLIIAAILSALTGAFIGKKLLKKVTYKSIQILVTIMLIILAFLLGFGII